MYGLNRLILGDGLEREDGETLDTGEVEMISLDVVVGTLGRQSRAFHLRRVPVPSYLSQKCKTMTRAANLEAQSALWQVPIYPFSRCIITC